MIWASIFLSVKWVEQKDREPLWLTMAHNEEGQSCSQSQWESKESPTLGIQGKTTTITVSRLKPLPNCSFLDLCTFGILCRQILQYKMTLFLHWLYMSVHTCMHDHRQAWHMQNNATQECTSKHQLYEGTMHYAHFTGRKNYLQSPTQRFPQGLILKILVTYLWMAPYTLVSRLPTKALSNILRMKYIFSRNRDYRTNIKLIRPYIQLQGKPKLNYKILYTPQRVGQQ